MKSTAKLNHKWDRERERERRERETKADFCSGHEWVGSGSWRDTRLQESMSGKQAASISQRSSNQYEQSDEMSGCQNIVKRSLSFTRLADGSCADT